MVNPVRTLRAISQQPAYCGLRQPGDVPMSARPVFLAVLVVLLRGSLSLLAEPTPVGVVVRLDEEGSVNVHLAETLGDPLFLAGRGVAVWQSRGVERWGPLPITAPEESDLAKLLRSSRRVDPAVGGGFASFGSPLDQLMGLSLVRGNGFITPAQQSRRLDPRITIRREPAERPPHFPAATLQILQRGRVLAQFGVAQGQATIHWHEIEQMPAELRDGLPPGEYTLREAAGAASATFVVEEEQLRDWIAEWPTRLRSYLGEHGNPQLFTLLEVENLLTQLDENSKPIPYLSDALDTLDDLPTEQRSPALDQLRREIIARLQLQPARTQIEDPTGVPAVDEARRLIALGRWQEARDRLHDADTSDERTRGLCQLYSAVILAESGGRTAEDTRECFERAVSLLQAHPAEAFRAHNNYGVHLLRLAQDGLYGLSQEMATGGQSPLRDALLYWRVAEGQLQSALDAATDAAPSRVPAVRVNQAQLYLLLADFLRSLPPTAQQEDLDQAVQAAARRASSLVSAALRAEGADQITRGAASELNAMLDYRSGDYESAAQAAATALSHYSAAGSLSGVESVCRLLGLCEKRLARNPKALNLLMAAHEIAELLRGRVPPDQVGASRAGFLARRAYVNQVLVELLIEQGEDAHALQIAELAKARSLQDMLSTNHASADHPSESRGLEDILADWPPDTTAIEYFIGAKHCWVFVVTNGGQVTTHALTNSDGTPVAPGELTGAVVRFCQDIQFQAVKMRHRLLSGQGFSHTWQQQLHEFYQTLMPQEARAAMGDARRVLIVPHHVLHYFPFAALVTQTDDDCPPNQIPKPYFLIDEPFSLAYAPSLATWDLLRGRTRPMDVAHAIGIVEVPGAPPLPGVEKDLQNFQAAFAGRVRGVTPGERATENATLDVLASPGMVLIATHGTNHADAPLTSHVLLNRDENSDGRLTALEVFHADLQSDLIVMSACYTGLADRSPLASDDLFGLQRAMLFSGARAVVSGLWDVYDGTGPILMNDCFQRLAKGEAVADALAGAQREFVAKLRGSKGTEPWIHPYFWAVYTTVGDPDVAFQRN